MARLLFLFILILQTAPASPKMEITLERNDRGAWRTVDSHAVLTNGDRVRFRFRTNYSGYLYVSNYTSSGAYQTLFPQSPGGSRNRIDADREYIIPADGWFRVAGPPGDDVIYWLLRPTKASTLLPRCDDSILSPRGDCLDTAGSNGPVNAPFTYEIRLAHK